MSDLVDLTPRQTVVSLADIRGAKLAWVRPDQMRDLYLCLADPPQPHEGIVPIRCYGTQVEVHPTYREAA